MGTFDAIVAVAREQHGAFALDQWFDAGLSRDSLRRECDRGTILRRHPSVYVWATHPAIWQQDVIAAVLSGGRHATVSHRSAARWWDLDRYRTPLVEITAPRGICRPHPEVKSHESLDLRGVDRTKRNGVMVTTPERTLVDVARYARGPKLAGLLDDAVRRKLTTYDRVQDRALELSRRGRAGPPHILEVLEDRVADAVPPGSTFEALMVTVLRGSSLPAPVRQHLVVVGSHRFSLDFAWPEARLGVECDGLRHHSMQVDVTYDMWRQNQIQVHAKYMLLRYPRRRLIDAPGDVLAEIAAALGSAGERAPSEGATTT